MTRILLTFALVYWLGLIPAIAVAETLAVKDPLNYPLRQYALILFLAMLGGVVSWYTKVRKGELAAWNVSSLVGEMTTSAFAGLMAFYFCEYMNYPPLLTAAVAGIAGHMGTRGIAWAEGLLQRRVLARQVGDTKPADLGEH